MTLHYLGRQLLLPIYIFICVVPASAASIAVATAPGVAAAQPWPAGDPIRLCAIRVEFVEDSITGTTGNGRFAYDSTESPWFPGDLIIDPLPHDKPYFEDHLAFLQHYCSTASKGAVTFSALDVYPAANRGAYQLPSPMWHYNYNIGDPQLSRGLVELFVDATHAAAVEVDFNSYDAIVIFHAGVGKDFNFGYDYTPFDIPSAYIDSEDIQAFGRPVPPGVTRGLILPEAENQQEALEFDVQLSLNGIMVKLFGNWLGLPDLFNTQNGRSGVGRWAMMDQGSGNLGALVPALPDAWSRVYMGWQDIITVPPSVRGDTVRVARFDVSGAPEIIKLPVTPREYYLVENRDADADSIGFVELRDRSGRILRVDQDGNMAVQEGFRVAVSASHYDYGIPGSGLLLWHIDEDVIAGGLASNRVNANAGHRGVDVVEADGAQDIGQEYGFATPGSGAELGVQEDAWFRENDAHRAANRGSPDVQFRDNTYPSARLYDGSFTYYELRGFSSVDSIMTFVARGTAVAPGFPVALDGPAEWGVADLDGDSLTELYLVSADSLYRADSSGVRRLIGGVPAGIRPSKLRPVDIDGDGGQELLFGGSRLGVLERSEGIDTLRLNNEWFGVPARVYPAGSVDGTPLLLVVQSDTAHTPPSVMFVGLYSYGLQQIDEFSFMSGGPIDPAVYNIDPFPASRFALVRAGEAIALAATSTGFDTLWHLVNASIEPGAVVLREPQRTSVFLNGYGYVDAENGTLLCEYPDCIVPDVDWDRDGVPDGGGLSGASTVPREDAPSIVADTSWVIDLDVDRDADLLGLSNLQDGIFTRWRAVEHAGREFRGFPMATSGTEPVRPFQWTASNDLYFVAETVDSNRYYYSVTKLPVLTRAGERFPFQDDVDIINVGALAPQVHARPDWLYCWPNPASSVSYIRVTADRPVRAVAHIFDLAGRKVADLAGSSSAAGAFELAWDVTSIESGVYIGQVRISGDGLDDQDQVKIAVVK